VTILEKLHRPVVLAGVLVCASIILLPTAGERRAEATAARSAAAAAQTSELDVIVRFKAPLTKSQHKRVSSYGGRLYRELPIINSAAYHISKPGFKNLLASGMVASYGIDHQVKASMDVTAAAVGANIANSYGWTG
jgi:hypothetical protein